MSVPMPAVEIVTADGGWRFRRLDGSSMVCTRRHRFEREATAFDATGPYWYLVLATLERGHVAYVCGRERVATYRPRYGAFLPPYSLVETAIDSAHQRIEVLISRRPLPADFPREPVLFETDETDLPHTLDEVRSVLGRGKGMSTIARNRRPSPVVRAAKARLDASFRQSSSIAEIASQLGIAHASLTRSFHRELGIPPAQYRTQLRITNAAMMLLHGAHIADTAFEVGFGDLGRFHKQFRSITQATPGRYRVSTPRLRDSTR
ncbi:MAG: helix-turn-helix transcriptional regulator [Polyangiaceae bacterium]|nr:helix-turn-helix transcriptional regulator [Polyangiaceae bacterium]